MFADHLALHMAGLGVVGADVSSLVISGDDLLGNGAVEEHQGRVGVLGHVDNGLSGVVGAGVNDVDNQDGSALTTTNFGHNTHGWSGCRWHHSPDT